MTKEIKPNVDPNIIRVFVVRHGRTEFNCKKIIQGHLDIDIDATGEEQAMKLAKYFDDFNSTPVLPQIWFVAAAQSRIS